MYLAEGGGGIHPAIYFTKYLDVEVWKSKFEVKNDVIRS